MGFFSDLKEDLSQAVNELLPDAEDTKGPKIPETPEVQEKKEETDDLDDLDLSDMLDRLDQLGADMGFSSEQSEKAYVPEEPMDILGAADAILAENQQTEETPVPEENIAAAETEDEAIEVSEAEELSEDAEEVISESVAEYPAETIEEATEEEVSEPEDILPETEPEETPVYEAKKETKEVTKMETRRVATDETAVITEGMTIRGDVETEGNLDLIGKVIGNVDILGKLNITGSIEGNSSASEIYAERAHVIGEVKSDGAVKIGQSSVIVGDVYGNSAVIAGAIKGDIDVKGPVILDSTAIVMGNIKSKSVQINNGAVIEGMCSQCYADVSPTTFFSDLKFV